MRRENANRKSINADAGATSRNVRAGAAVVAAGFLVIGAAACNDTARPASGDAAAKAPMKSAAKSGTVKDGSVTSDGEPGIPTCAAGDLKMRLGRTSPGAGNVYVPLVFTNDSDRTCELKGYPGVSLLDGSRSMIGKPAHEVRATRHYVNLAPGESGRVILHTLNRGVSSASCWQRAEDLRAYPPGSKASIVVPAHGLQICGGEFTVSIMKPGTGA